MLVFVAFGVYYVVRQPFSPSDWVEVTIRNIPKGVRKIYLIADGPDGPRAFSEYRSKVVVFPVPPRFEEEPFGDDPMYQYFDAVQWPNAHRYGALAHRSDGTWELWWLGPDERDGPSISRYIFGGGTAEIRLPDESRAMTPSRKLLQHIGVPTAAMNRPRRARPR
jgi:hypothetical protein